MSGKEKKSDSIFEQQFSPFAETPLIGILYCCQESCLIGRRAPYLNAILFRPHYRLYLYCTSLVGPAVFEMSSSQNFDKPSNQWQRIISSSTRTRTTNDEAVDAVHADRTCCDTDGGFTSRLIEHNIWNSHI